MALHRRDAFPGKTRSFVRRRGHEMAAFAGPDPWTVQTVCLKTMALMTCPGMASVCPFAICLLRRVCVQAGVHSRHRKVWKIWQRTTASIDCLKLVATDAFEAHRSYLVRAPYACCCQPVGHHFHVFANWRRDQTFACPGVFRRDRHQARQVFSGPGLRVS